MLYLKFALENKVKESKNGKFSSHYKLARSILKRKFPSVYKPRRIYAPPKIKPFKKAFEKYEPRGLFSEFYGILTISPHFFYKKSMEQYISKGYIQLTRQSWCCMYNPQEIQVPSNELATHPGVKLKQKTVN